MDRIELAQWLLSNLPEDLFPTGHFNASDLSMRYADALMCEYECVLQHNRYLDAFPEDDEYRKAYGVSVK